MLAAARGGGHGCPRSGRGAVGVVAAVIAFALLGSPPPGTAARMAALQERPALPPDAEKIGDDRYRVGKVTVDLKSKTATCAGQVNMVRGPVEYLAVARGGKVHESVLRLDVRPLHFQVALILLGLEPKGGLTRQGDTHAPQGSPVDLRIGWQRKGRPVKVRAEELVWDVRRKGAMQPQSWVFTGSSTNEQGFVADLELSLIATYRDPVAIINNGLPEGTDDTAYKVNERIVPPLNTAVTVIAAPAGPAAAGDR
jgi:hypothetical protein